MVMSLWPRFLDHSVHEMSQENVAPGGLVQTLDVHFYYNVKYDICQ